MIFARRFAIIAALLASLVFLAGADADHGPDPIATNGAGDTI